MGHCEMLLAVAGLKQDQIAERTRSLAEGDWSKFSEREQAAFAFAHKLSKSPSMISDDDVAALTRHFGPQRALDVIWWTCRCHYMTRVADAFQLPLEREDVFEGLVPRKKSEK